MPIFTYTAINPEGKSVRGTVEAPSQESAKTALKELHYEVKSIGEPTRKERASPPAPAPSISGLSFQYEGTDSAGVPHKGTQQAKSKREAFDLLKKNHRLTLTKLSPLGAPSQSSDPELLAWQKETTQPTTLSFNPSTGEPTTPVKTSKKIYHPLVTTLRLYAGWLLAWYALFVAVGYYVRTRELPWDIPFVAAFAGSSLVFSFIAAIFFFLLLSTVQRALKGGTLLGSALAFTWVVLVVGIRFVSV